MVLTGVMLLAATFVSEDAATVTAGALVAADTMSAASAASWVGFGIWAGDLGLFAIGRLARRMPAVARWVDRRWPFEQLQRMEQRFTRSAPLAILGSRFLPGTRVLLYVAAGLFRVPTSTFAISAAVASFAWTFMVVSTIGSLGALW